MCVLCAMLTTVTHAADTNHMMSLVYNWPSAQVDAIVVTDGSRILGLGDLGEFNRYINNSFTFYSYTIILLIVTPVALHHHYTDV
jgi:Malic enzyme, N-terminal domain